MRELLLLLALTPIGLLVVLSDSLATFKVAEQPAAAVVVTAAVPLAAPSTPVPAIVQPVAQLTDMVARVIAEARTWLGTPYLWGGCGRHGVDCSCFVHNAYLTVGVNTPRTTVEQIRWATPVSRDQLVPGDIVFFNDTCTGCGANPTHEGLYLGGGQMIEAGDPVQVASVFTGFYGAHYAGAGRPR